jgi:hypothetical protein
LRTKWAFERKRGRNCSRPPAGVYELEKPENKMRKISQDMDDALSKELDSLKNCSDQH